MHDGSFKMDSADILGAEGSPSAGKRRRTAEGTVLGAEPPLAAGQAAGQQLSAVEQEGACLGLSEREESQCSLLDAGSRAEEEAGGPQAGGPQQAPLGLDSAAFLPVYGVLTRLLITDRHIRSRGSTRA